MIGYFGQDSEQIKSEAGYLQARADYVTGKSTYNPASQQDAPQRSLGGLPDGELIFSAAGQTFAGWTSVSVTRTVEGMPSRFDVRGTVKFPGELRGVIPINSPCTITIGGHVVLTGFLERYVHAIGAEDHNVVLTGRGRCCDLVDCAARIENQTVVQTSIVALAKKLVQPFAGGAIQVIAPDGDGNGERFAFTIDLGETPYEVIERIARYEGLLTYENESGDLVLARVGKVKHASGFAEGKNIQSAELSIAMDGRFSVYTPLLMSTDPYSHDGSGGYGGNRAGADVIDRNVNRYRPRIIVSEQANNGQSLAEQRAVWEMNQRAGRSFRASLVCDSWLDSAGTPWTPNQIAPLVLPSLGISEPGWVIAEVTYSRNGRSGTTATVVLYPPEAFSIEPSAPNAVQARMLHPDTSSGGATGAAPALPATQPSAPNAGTTGRRDR